MSKTTAVSRSTTVNQAARSEANLGGCAGGCGLPLDQPFLLTSTEDHLNRIIVGMRLLHIADWHLGDRLGRIDRTPDLRRAVERVACCAGTGPRNARG
jgi:hypothetical protein